MWKNLFFRLENFLDERKIFACGKTSLIMETFLHVETSFLVKNFLDQRKIFTCGETSLFMEKSLLVENFLYHRKIYSYRKTFLIIGKSLLAETFYDQEIILTCTKFSAYKVLCLWKTFFIKEKFWLMKKFLDRGKTISLSLLKISLFNKKILMLKQLRYIFINLEQKFNLLTFLLTKKNSFYY